MEENPQNIAAAPRLHGPSLRGSDLGPLPKTDDEKRDQWMVRFSRATGKNLGPFFQTWGVPTSQAARDSIQEMPGWMPADWPKM